MVNANLLLAAGCGLIGAAVMIICIYLLHMGGHDVNLPLFLGSYFFDINDTARVYTAGIALHLFIGACWGVIFLILMTGLGIYPNWPAGILWGFAQGIFIGVMMATLGENHPYIGHDKPYSEPGVLGRRWSPVVPYIVLGLHVLFGFVTLLFYRILIVPVK